MIQHSMSQPTINQRIQQKFTHCQQEHRPALVTYIMAGDSSLQQSRELLLALPDAGADIVELGMPFSDPTADGVSIQRAGERALKAGTKMQDVLALSASFRAKHPHIPLILMGYYNPILRYGVERFVAEAAKSGVDGLIVVDVPPEEEAPLKTPLEQAGLSLIRLIAPTTQGTRLPMLLEHASGFVYTIAVKGVTGGAATSAAALNARVAEIRAHTSLPVAAGFGIRTPDQIRELRHSADALVVGSALVDAAHVSHEHALTLVQNLRNACENSCENSCETVG